MKNFVKNSLPGIIVVLLIAAVFVVPIVRGFLNEDERSVAIIGLLILVLFVLMAVIGIKRRSSIKKRATARTSGIISGVRISPFGEEHSDFTCWFKISYHVDGQEYQISEVSEFETRQAAKQFVGKKVTVYYDPNRPRIAWAEFPRKA